MQKYHTGYIIIIFFLILVIVGGFFYLNNKAITNIGVATKQIEQINKRGLPVMGGMRIEPVTPPALSDQQTQQIMLGSSTSISEKTFNITAGNFFFVPNKIIVNKGDKVTFVIINAGGLHDIVIDELGVKSSLSKTAQTQTVIFIATKKGSFTYYCNVPGHKAKGMMGTLVVQ
ncbi:MAG TPA: plastocyanin/azurin family copper-binding protein [Candidatus Saccharimonadales bacterium]|nr:plastocyanin/azurin family copper-binding protein [Candidatus Saccharimonadales bacterium]